MQHSHRAAMPDAGIEHKWAVLLPLREQALRVAQARASSRADAEDLVSEAMLRAVRVADLRPETAGGLLAAIISNLAIDGHRRTQTATRLRQRLAPHNDPEALDEVLDRAEATWLHEATSDLPTREREVLLHRAAGHTNGSTAATLGLTYKAVESAYTRARARMIETWSKALGILLGCGAAVRRLLGRTQPAATTMIAALAALAWTLLPYDGATGRALPRENAVINRPPPELPISVPAARMPRGQAAAGMSASRAPTPSAQPTEFYTGPLGHPSLLQTGVRIRKENGDETTVQTLERCLRNGIYLELSRVRCRDTEGPPALLPAARNPTGG